jgi:glycosyltransferase involved in cell wall biosynthesis
VSTASRLRVLWLTKGLGAGGAERLLVEQAAAGDHDRFDYEAAYLLPVKRALVPELERLDVPTRCLGVRTDTDLRWVWRLAAMIRDRRYDVVHAHSPLSASVARVLVRSSFRSTAVVYTEHNRWQSHNPVTRAANRATFALNDHVFAVSSDVLDSMTPKARARTEVLVHGIDLAGVRAHRSDRALVRRELGIDDHEVLAVTVANLRENKRYPDLLAAARHALDRGAPVRFVAAGQGPLEEEVHAEHRRLGLGDRFALLGYRADAQRLIAAADLFVLASSHEGLPVAVMEAFAAGVPVVATAAGGMAEAVTDGVDGLLVPPLDPEALAGAICRAADPALRATLAAGAALAGARYSATASVEAIEATYEKVARRR